MDDEKRAAEAAKQQYLESCQELSTSISTLQSALVAFLGKDDGVRENCFPQTRARLEQEMSQAGGGSKTT